LERWLNKDLRSSFEGRILPVSDGIASRWAAVSARLERKGATPAIFDGLIAATALEHNLTVVTRNVDDFLPFGVPIVNPWE
jgi:predicted nucleic acid-binding protein